MINQGKAMKLKIILFVLLVPFASVFGQRPQRCDVPLPDQVFKQKQRSVMLQTTDELKLRTAINIVSENCLSVEQVRLLAEQFSDDFTRLDFAKAAWHNTVDKENYYYVYDAFAYFSAVFMLHDYVQTVSSRPIDYIPPYDPPLSLNFPALNYPSYETYQGPFNCNYPIREDVFLDMARQVLGRTTEADRLFLLTQLAQNNCLSMAQAMKFSSLLQSEENRISYFRVAVLSIYDTGNLPLGAQMFAHIPNKSEYNSIISNPSPQPQPVLPPPCTVTEEELTQILASIKKESFNSTRLTIAKQILKSKQCFTTGQVKEIVNLFSFDDSKLEIAEYGWDYTLDRDNYYQVAEVFSFSSTKEKLMKFLETK